MRVVVSGGRDFARMGRLFRELDSLRALFGGFTFLGEGGEPNGADRMARTWAQLRGIPTSCIVAEWQKFGKAAGPLRNTRLIDELKPDLIVAFPTGGPGTTNMIKQARERKIKLEIFE